MNEELKLYEQARETGEKAARKAGELIARTAGKISPDEIREKGINDIVTAVDEEAQRVIVEAILEVFPGHKILAEEDLDTRGVDSEPAEYLWIIDPIDGTTNFTRGIPPYAVSIALAHKNRLVVGVVLDVANNDMYTAVFGRGLSVNGEPAGIRRSTSLSKSVITTGFPYRSFGHVDLYLTVLKQFMKSALAIRRPGSAAVDLAWVASGRFDGFFETGLKPWDVAAGIVLVREGGGLVSNYAGDPDPAFDQQIVASNGLIHDEMLSLLEPMSSVVD